VKYTFIMLASVSSIWRDLFFYYLLSKNCRFARWRRRNTYR